MDVYEPKPEDQYSPDQEALVHEVLGRVADRWTLLVIEALDGEQHVRFTQLQRKLDGISQKMLTKTLRQLERDGLVARRVHPTVPPRVDYTLTPLGESFGHAVCRVWTWIADHIPDVQRARLAYDGKTQDALT